MSGNTFSIRPLRETSFIDIRDRVRPELVYDIRWLVRCRIKILIVTDSSSGGFSDTQGFHIGQIIRILADDPWSHITFGVTKAHLETGSGADVNNFRFDSHDLHQYSQI